MKTVAILISACFITSCSSVGVEKTGEVVLDTLFFGTIENREEITLEANESKFGRVLIGTITAGPIGAIATANTEEDFGKPKAFDYQLRLQDGTQQNIVSRSIVGVGSCVEVISSDDSEIEILKISDSQRC